MDFDQMFSALNISSSALHAERMRMDVVADNLARANVTVPPGQTPPSRETIIFKAVFDEARRGVPGAEALGGVEVEGVYPSSDPPRMVREPGHPHADENGFVAYPNISSFQEMANLISSSRSYGANLAVIRTFKDIMNKTLSIGS